MSSITYIGLDVHTTNYTICSFNGYGIYSVAPSVISNEVRNPFLFA